MAFGFQVAAGAKPTGTAPQDQSFAAGFPVKAYILIATGQVTPAAFAGHCVIGIGGTDGSTEECVEIASEDAVGTSSTQRGQGNKVLRILDPTTPGTPLAEAIHKNFTDGAGGDGVTITWNVNDAVASGIFCWMFGDDDLTNVKMGRFQAKTTTGDLDVTGLGFDPTDDDTVLFLWCSQNGNQSPVPTPPAINTQAAALMFGFVAQYYGTQQVSYGTTHAAEGGQATSDADNYNPSGFFRNIYYKSSIASEEGRFIVLDWITDGFRTKWSVAAALAWNIDYLCIKGGRFYATSGLTPTSSSPGTVAATGLGTACKGVIAVSACRPVSGSPGADISLALGAAYDDGGSKPFPEQCVWIGDDDAVGTMAADRRISITKVLELCTAGTPTLDEAADVESFDSDGVTFNWSTADATQRSYGLLMMGDAVATATSRRRVFAQVA